MAKAEARKGLAEGGIPIGAAIFDVNGNLVGAGHNRRAQNGDPSLHGETDAFRSAGLSVQLSQAYHGHYTGALLVLQRARTTVWLRHADSL